jgi:hypothetical protein
VIRLRGVLVEVVTALAGGIAATWRMTDGTGLYADLRGEGRWSQVVANGILTFTCWGVLTEAR